MEALAALSLAANVMQVVQFAAQIITTGNEIFQTGSTSHNAEIELVSADLKVLNDNLKGFARPDSLVQGPLTQDYQVRIPTLTCWNYSLSRAIGFERSSR